jgi:transposase
LHNFLKQRGEVGYTWPYGQKNKATPTRLARSTALTRLGIAPNGLAAERHRGSARRNTWFGQPVAKTRLSQDQLAELKEQLAKGAEHFGFRGDVWTQPRVAQLIKREFGVSYHPSHVGRILKQMGWSRQKPITRASQRNEAAIERWRTAKWTELEKKPSVKDAP